MNTKIPLKDIAAGSEQEAETLKNNGNILFKEGNYNEALDFYSRAIEVCPQNHLLWTNRSMTFAALKQWDKSQSDAERALEICPEFVKGYFRLAKAHLEQGHFEDSLECCKKGMSYDTNAESLKIFEKIEKSALEGMRLSKDDQFSVTIKDFKVILELGRGNFSTIYSVQHLSSGIMYAMKVIDKSEVTRMKRRHGDIEKEILMEKRALCQLKGHPGIITMYASFQDFSSLYFLLELCDEGELWARLIVNDKPVGIYPSLAKFWVSELVLVLEHIHSKGMVHRDIKPENILMTASGHIKVVDFGTCKDLLNADLNGSEFVGTAQYMTPQAVDSESQGREADLWALGCCLFQFLTGRTPYHAPSPYLCFLKIRTGIVRYPRVVSETAKNLIRSLIKPNPSDRMGSDEMGGYPVLKAHPYFNDVAFDSLFEHPAVRVPKLSEMAVRVLGNFIEYWGNNAIFVPNPLPANINIWDLSEADREAVRHYLHRIKALHHPKVFRLFNASAVDAKCRRADLSSREFLGLDWDTHGQWNEPFFFMHIANPLIGKSKILESDGVIYNELTYVKECVNIVNKLRPRFVVVSGEFVHSKHGSEEYQNELEAFRKAMGKISETIPVLYCAGENEIGNMPSGNTLEEYQSSFGSDYYGFWWGGLRGLVVNSPLLASSNQLADESASTNRSSDECEEQVHWLNQELELAQLNAHHLVVFGHHQWFPRIGSNADVGQSIFEQKRLKWLRKMGQSKVSAIFSSYSGYNGKFAMTKLPQAPLEFSNLKTLPSTTVDPNALCFQDKSKEICSEMAGRKDQDFHGDSLDHEKNSNVKLTEKDEFSKQDDMPISMQHISTASLSYPENNEPHGVRVVRVFERSIETEFYPLELVPETIDIAAQI